MGEPVQASASEGWCQSEALGTGGASVRRECHAVMTAQSRERDQAEFEQLNDSGNSTKGCPQSIPEHFKLMGHRSFHPNIQGNTMTDPMIMKWLIRLTSNKDRRKPRLAQSTHP